MKSVYFYMVAGALAGWTFLGLSFINPFSDCIIEYGVYPTLVLGIYLMYLGRKKKKEGIL